MSDVDPLADLPTPNRPPLPPGRPNAPVILYDGPVQFTQHGETFQAQAQFEMAWLPSPGLRFRAPLPSPEPTLSLGTVSFRLPDGTAGEGYVSRLGRRSGRYPSAVMFGRISAPLVRPSDMPAQSVRFMLPNFPYLIGKGLRWRDGWYAGRVVLEGGGWVITLDAHEDVQAHCEALADRSGYGVTHVGRIVKRDGLRFTWAEARGLLESLTCYTSFAAGRWAGPCLPAGYDEREDLIWQAWDCYRSEAYQHRESWLDSLTSKTFEDSFVGFMARRAEPLWHDVIQSAVHWYVEANGLAGSVEGSIVLTQTAFELLASVVLVETERWLSNDAHEKLSAADRMRLLFVWAGIPTAVPPELAELTRLAKAENWPDSPTAMTMIRNTITHPTAKNRQKFDKHQSGARHEVWRLGLWYLELCLLKLFGHNGRYANRLRRRFSGEAERVPWAPPRPPA